MSIIKFIEKVCKQPAVYWGNPQNDGYGGMTFDEPREIKCRWTDKTRVIFFSDGKEDKSRSEVLVTEDLDFEGWLYLGTMASIEDPEDNYNVPANPKEVLNAYEIIAIDKIPLIYSTTEFVRTVFLGFGNGRSR